MSLNRILLSILSIFILEAATMTALTPEAQALPVFARKYNISCNSCHTAFPKLNTMGIAFRERGFRMIAGKADLGAQAQKGGNTALGDNTVVTDGLPIALRTQISYATADGATLGGVEGASKDNPLFGIGEYGLLSSGSYDNFSWWADANLVEVEMLEGQWYFSDLVKVRFGNIQNNVGYGMTMMSNRPLGEGTDNLAISSEMGMLAMGTGIGINGTTDGGSGLGTAYNFSYNLEGKDATTGKTGSSTFARLSQSFGGHNIGVFTKSGSNLTMGSTTMFLESQSRSGLDFAIFYGQPFQIWGAVTSGKDKGTMTMTAGGTAMALDRTVSATTLSGEYMMSGGILAGLKYDSLAKKTTTGTGMMASTEEETLTNTTFFVLKQLAENLQLSLASTGSATKVGSTTTSQSTYNLTMDFAL